MRTTAHHHTRHIKPLKPEALALQHEMNNRTSSIAVVRTTLLAVASIGLYGLLYRYGNDLIAVARHVHDGHKALFFVPVVIALVFSFVHGAFTGHFWDAVGLKPGKK